MSLRFRNPLLFSSALMCIAHSLLPAQSSDHRGLWVGEVVLNAVNEVTVPLDAQNIPRAPDPNVPTPTFDAANLRLILHVDAVGKVSLLKQVAILSKKGGTAQSDNDVALVTDPSLYGSFPPQPASRISSVAFDFGDAKAIDAVNEVISRASIAARDASAPGSATTASVQAAAKLAAQPVVAAADAEAAFRAFLENDLGPAQVLTIANSGVTTTMNQRALDLKNGSFFADSRGVEMLAAIESVLAGLPASTTAAGRQQAALNAASSFVEKDSGYERFLAGELFGDMVSTASSAAASAAGTLVSKEISGFQTSQAGASVAVVSAAHGLTTGEEIAIRGAAVGGYNGVHSVVRIDDDSFRIPVPFTSGGAIAGFSGATNVSPTVILLPGHGFSNGSEILIKGSAASYNGRRIVTVIDADRFSINAVFNGTPSIRGSVVSKSGGISGFEGTPDGSAPVKITSPGHNLNNGQRIEISGSGSASYNGVKVITRVDVDSFTIDQAFAGNPSVKGAWELLVGIDDITPPEVVATLANSPAHGLRSGDKIVISGSGKTEYNAGFTITVVDVDSFSFPFVFDAATGDPAVKGSWLPAASPEASWTNIAGIRSALAQSPKVDEAKNAARSSNTSVASYNDSRAEDAVNSVLDSIVKSAAADGTQLTTQVAFNAAQAARKTLADDVPRYPAATVAPSSDYTNFVRSLDFLGAIDTAAGAAAAAAIKEKGNIISTPESIEGKARAAAIEALSGIIALASRSMVTELAMNGAFGVGSSGLSAEVLLPMNHPTNPFRHRRHPDHVNGIEIRRLIHLGFDSADSQPLGKSGYGVDRITGGYEEEIFGLHKPLGPSKDIGLKVKGTFSLNRISRIDTLNGR